MNDLLITRGRVVDPSQRLDAMRDVRIRGGVIVEIGEHLSGDEPALDAQGAVVAPGFIDMHVHLREPGLTHKETIATGTAAAVAGGFTAVACMPNTQPAIDTPAIVRDILMRAAGAPARVYPVAAITKGREGRELAPYHLLADAGAVAFSDDGDTVEDARVLRQAALYAGDLRGPFISHCLDHALHAGALLNEGAVSARLGLAGSPALAEETIVARDLLVAAETKKAWHIAHLSTANGADLIRYFRSRGGNATCEVTPHHLLLADDHFETYRADAKVNPPLRTDDDIRALRDAVRDGTIDAFATDHAPHAADEKAQLLSVAPVGFTGLEVALGAYALALPDLALERFVALLSTNPARILGVPGGTLAVGSPADVTVFAERPWTLDAQTLHSKGKNTPFDGWTFPRRAIATVVGGRVVFSTEQIAV